MIHVIDAEHRGQYRVPQAGSALRQRWAYIGVCTLGVCTMKTICSCAFTLALILISGCASIVSKSKYPVSITTEPTAAKIEIKDQDGVLRFAGTSPATAVLDAGQGYFTRARYTVTASKEGFNTSTYPLQNSIDGWYWGNILIGGLIGLLIVDPITGAMFQIDTPVANMSLAPATAQVSMEGDRIRKLQDLRNSGVLTEAEYQSKKKAILRDL